MADLWESIITALITEGVKGGAGALAGQATADANKEAAVEAQKLRNEGELAITQLQQQGLDERLKQELAQKMATDILNAKTQTGQTALSGMPSAYRNLLEALAAAQQIKAQGFANTGAMGQRAAMGGRGYSLTG